MFDAPKTVLRGLSALCGINMTLDGRDSSSAPSVGARAGACVVMGGASAVTGSMGSRAQHRMDIADRIEQAYLPELSLSNKAKESMSQQEAQEQVRWLVHCMRIVVCRTIILCSSS